MISPNETISIGWCDNGITDGKFVEGIMSVALSSHLTNFTLSNFVRVQGNQIANQRQVLLDYWYDNYETDWLFWVDSDIFITLDIWREMFSTANKETHPMVSGVYFIIKGDDGLLPCIFDDVDEFNIKYHHPLPENEVIKVDCAGMGLVLMHRSVVKTLRDKYGKEDFLFEEKSINKNKFTGEDISFFRKCKNANIPLYANTKAVAQHIKKLPLDLDFYKMYWTKEYYEKEIKNTPPS
jgi:hypothetical protein